MKRIARFGNVWKHRKTDKIHGTSIDVASFEELQEYEQIPKKRIKEFGGKDKTVPKDNQGEAEEGLTLPSARTRGSQQ